MRIANDRNVATAALYSALRRGEIGVLIDRSLLGVPEGSVAMFGFMP